MSYELFQKGDSKIWHYRFQIDGKRVQRSTRETVKRRATQIAEDAYEKAKLWARGKRHIPTLHELATEWLSVHEPIVSQHHHRSVKYFTRLHLYGLRELLIDELTTDLVTEARSLHLKTHAAASANHWLNILNVLCNWAVRRGVIPKLPYQIKKLKLQKKPRVMLSPRVAGKWVETVDTEAGERQGIKMAVRLMIGLGLRESECLTARWEWLDWDRKTYTPGITKGREAVPLPIPAWLLGYLEPRRAAQGLIVTRPDGHAYASGFCRQAMRAANAACEAGKLTPHRLRGTYATLLSEEGIPVQTVQYLMRHKDAKTTMGYLEINVDTAVRGQRGMAERLGFENVPRETSP